MDNVSHSIGDTVTVDGYVGTWKVKGFAHDYRSSSQNDIGTALVSDVDGSQLFYPSQYVNKVK